MCILGDLPELSLIPLPVVLYPHMPLPLRVFEPRYQALLRDCRGSGGQFGVVAIHNLDEVEGSANPELVGTAAVITKVRPLGDGRSHLVATGAHRFRIRQLLTGMPYLRA